MLGALFKRFRPSAPPAAANARQPEEPAEQASSETAAAATEAAPVVYGVRRPLISAKGGIAGFEFRLSESTRRRLLERGDSSARNAHTSALLTSMHLTAQGGRIAFAEMDIEWLGAPELPSPLSHGIFIALASDPGVEGWTQYAAPLRRAGARLGWDEQLPLTAAPDFRLLRLNAQAVGLVPALLQRWKAKHPGAPLIATDAGSVDALEAALHAGVDYACGELASDRSACRAEPLPAQVLRVQRLLRSLGQDADLRELAADIKTDVALSYRLLRFANSAAMGASRKIESVEQAILVLGRRELKRWLSLMLINASVGRPAARALQEIALARAQLLELLASARGEARPDGFFTLGLASMLGVLLRMPLEAAIEPLSLPEPALQALIEGRGPWRPHLELALLLERQKTIDAESHALAFGGIGRVLALSDRAWTWAAESTADLHG